MNTDSPESRTQSALAGSAATFFGGITLTVVHEDGKTATIKVRQLRLADYETALQFEKDEFALTAFCCSAAAPDGDPNPHSALRTPQSKPWVLTLLPESYEQLRTKVEEVNKNGFFSFARRKAERDREEKQELMQTIAQLPPEALKAFSEATRSLSPPQSPRPRPR